MKPSTLLRAARTRIEASESFDGLETALRNAHNELSSPFDGPFYYEAYSDARTYMKRGCQCESYLIAFSVDAVAALGRAIALAEAEGR